MIERYFEEGAMFPSSSEAAEYLEFPVYEQPCIHNHPTPRYTSCKVCIGCLRDYDKRNPHVKVAIYNRYRARKLKACPAWANQEKISEIYRQSQEISSMSGIPHDVDHEIPLQGKYVCGLHVETNLRIIPASENRQKRNKFPIH